VAQRAATTPSGHAHPRGGVDDEWAARGREDGGAVLQAERVAGQPARLPRQRLGLGMEEAHGVKAGGNPQQPEGQKRVRVVNSVRRAALGPRNKPLQTAFSEDAARGAHLAHSAVTVARTLSGQLPRWTTPAAASSASSGCASRLLASAASWPSQRPRSPDSLSSRPRGGRRAEGRWTFRRSHAVHGTNASSQIAEA
jgi:hypothetical protein